MAFELAGIPYKFGEDHVAGIGRLDKDEFGQQALCSYLLLHLDYLGKPFWWNGSLFLRKHVQNELKEWLKPLFWVTPTSRCVYDYNCIYTDNVHNMSADGYDQVYINMVQEATTINALFDDLILVDLPQES